MTSCANTEFHNKDVCDYLKFSINECLKISLYTQSIIPNNDVLDLSDSS